jgi:1-acyl-sn-glycerol-3-phosphate acyltransferase
VDIPVLQKLLNRRVPFLRFFLKSQLIWVPLLGPAWWALDFPFMKRYSRETLAKHPELQGKDREATRRACAKFRQLPVSVMNFVEGTRFTPAKHDAQGSPYRHLLRPRAGGVAFVLDAMGEGLQTILEIAIVYPGGPCSLSDLIAGRLREVRVSLRQRPIEPGLRGDYERDAAFRQRFQAWINALWDEHDARIGRLLAGQEPQLAGD